MTTSGVYEFDPNTTDVITSAFRILQAVGQGEDLSGNQYNDGIDWLNRLLKFWEAQGIHLWTMTEYFLFFEVGQAQYDLRNPLTRVVNEFDFTTAAAAAPVSATSIEVVSTANMALGRAIGFVNASNDMQWSVIERIDGTTVHFRDALTTAVNSGAIIRHYATRNLGQTAISANEAIGETVISLLSVVDIRAGYVIGIAANDDSVHFSTVVSVDFDNDEVLINDPITVASDMGNAVFFYESEQNFIPLSRIPETDSVRRNAGELTDYEIPIVFQSREDYFNLPNKRQLGTPIQAYYSRQEPQGIWYLWNVPSTAVEYLTWTGERQIQIQELARNTFDLPAEWHLALSYNLAKLLIPIVGCSPQRVQLIRDDAQDYLQQVLAFDSAMYPIELKPERYG